MARLKIGQFCTCKTLYGVLIFLLTTVFFLLCSLQSCKNASGMLTPYAATDTLRNKDKFLVKALAMPVDSIVVVKHFRHMYVFNEKKLLKVYHISLGTSPIGPKHFQGDRKTPEGIYYINGKNPNSQAHKSLAISYPNDNDRKYARSFGQPTGGDVKIHGLLNGYEDEKDEFVKTDWTWGCIAVTNEEIDELYSHVVIGSPINILP